MTVLRDRRDRCPGVLRPWPAEDGLLVRLRLLGGQVSSATLLALVEAAERYGDGRVHVTSRANLQLRGFPGSDGRLTQEALAALDATGLLPSYTHELVRNVMVSPLSGLAGGRADLRPVAAELDRMLCASSRLGELPGKFLFVLDDGRGDLMDQACDLGLVALDADTAQLRVGEAYAEPVALRMAAVSLVGLSHEFLDAAGTGRTAPWHLSELPESLVPPIPPDPRLPAPTGPLAHGPVPGGEHVAVPDGGLDRDAVAALAARADHLVVTPWRGIVVPDAGGDAHG